MKSSDSPLLSVSNLKIGFRQGEAIKTAVEGISFSLNPGESLGIVGESGSGKSITSLAIMGLLPPNAVIQEGEVQLELDKGKPLDLLNASDDKIRSLRGKTISMIFQEPMSALNPLEKCGAQVAEAIKVHKKLSKSELKEQVLKLFERVELPDPERAYDAYPHEISGGQKQRVMIAMAVSCEPKLIIADEPTTALDVTVQGKILTILQKLCSDFNTALIFITHDLGVVSKVSDKLLVMRKGQVIERGSTHDVLHRPKEEYTRALIECRPRLDFSPYRLPIVGQDKIETAPNVKPDLEKELLKVENLNLSFAMKKDWLGKPTAYFKALQDINFHVLQGETLGLVGESGCGKTTLGRSLIKLVPIDSGSIKYQGTELAGMSEKEFKFFRKKIQIVFQDPYGSLNPRFTVGESISEPMIYHKITSGRKEARSRAMDILDKVGLEKAAFSKYPHEFSGGQRQRVCIARALSVNPEFLICDESVSALDVSVQAKVLNLLNDLKEELNLTYIFISHDLSVVKYMSDRVMVMRKGKVVEIQNANELYKNPESDYTKELIQAIPEI